MQTISDIKKEMEEELEKLRLKRKGVVTRFKKKLEEAKIEQIKSSIKFDN